MGLLIELKKIAALILVASLVAACDQKALEVLPTGASPSSLVSDIKVDGLPKTVSNVTTLSLTVSGSGVSQYIYAYTAGATTCNNAKYSEWTDVGTGVSITLGADGAQMFCLLALSVDGDGKESRTPYTYAWTKDSTAPAAAITTRSALGPNQDSGTSAMISGTATDVGSGIAKVQVSVRAGTGSCLNNAKTAFTATCPNLQDATGTAAWTFPITKSILTNGTTYKFTAIATDVAGNTEATGSLLSLAYDTTPPAAPATFTATIGQESLAVSWTAVSDAASYLVFARTASPVAYTPVAGTSYKAGDLVGNSTVVAFAGTTNSFAHSDLTAYTAYYYSVYAIDGAGNFSVTGTTGTGTPIERNNFKGINNAFLFGPSGNITVEWLPYYDGSTALSSINYSVYYATTSGGQNFSATAAATVTGGASSLNFTYAGSATDLYIVVRETRSGSTDTNTREFQLRLGSGYHHKLASTGRYTASIANQYTFMRASYSLIFDPWDNIVFSSQSGTLLVLCQEISSAFYCKGRTQGRVYTIAGADGLGDGASAVQATLNPTGLIQGVASDSYGNLYLGDSTFFRIRAICYDPSSPGFCNGKYRGFMYNIGGTGVTGDGVTNTVSTSAAIATVYSVAADNKGNVFIGDGTNHKIRTICYYVTGSTGYCSGKTVGNMYTSVGTGTLVDGADVSGPTAVGIGEPRAIDIDNYDNIVFADWDYRRVRAVCYTVSSSGGWCNGKTSGTMYRVFGSNVAGDTADNIAGNNAAVAGQFYGLALDSYGNIFLGDNQFSRLRVICVENAATGFCNGATVGNIYRIAGTSATTDGANDALAQVTSIGVPRAVALDSKRNLFTTDGTNFRIRAVCANVSVGGQCDTAFPGNMYNIVGVGTGTMGWGFVQSWQTPIGTPQGVAVDLAGNIYSADSTNFRVRVMCVNTSVGACVGKTAGKSYFIAGTGVSGDAADALSPTVNTIGAVNGLAVDSNYNLYMADSTNRRIRVICYTVASGTCNARTAGLMYRLMGTGAAVDQADNSLASTAGSGTISGIAVDDLFNLHLADNQYFRVRTICYGTSAGFCSGKTAGNMYRVAGNTAVAADGANNIVAISNNIMGTVNAIAVDASRNIWLADAQFFRIRAICINTTAGYCVGKTAGNSYQVVGTGVTGDGATGGTANVTTTGATNGLVVDAYYNVYWTDNTYGRVRVVCNNTTGGYCASQASGNSYRVAGNGVLTGDAVSNIDSNGAGLNMGTTAILAIHPTTGDLIFSGSNSLRMIRGW